MNLYRARERVEISEYGSNPHSTTLEMIVDLESGDHHFTLMKLNRVV